MVVRFAPAARARCCSIIGGAGVKILDEIIGCGTGDHWDTVPPVECEILTLTRMDFNINLHGRCMERLRPKGCPRLVEAVAPLVDEIRCITVTGTAGWYFGTSLISGYLFSNYPVPLAAKINNYFLL